MCTGPYCFEDPLERLPVGPDQKRQTNGYFSFFSFFCGREERKGSKNSECVCVSVFDILGVSEGVAEEGEKSNPGLKRENGRRRRRKEKKIRCKKRVSRLLLLLLPFSLAPNGRGEREEIIKFSSLWLGKGRRTAVFALGSFPLELYIFLVGEKYKLLSSVSLMAKKREITFFSPFSSLIAGATEIYCQSHLSHH